MIFLTSDTLLYWPLCRGLAYCKHWSTCCNSIQRVPSSIMLWGRRVVVVGALCYICPVACCRAKRWILLTARGWSRSAAAHLFNEGGRRSLEEAGGHSSAACFPETDITESAATPTGSTGKTSPKQKISILGVKSNMPLGMLWHLAGIWRHI